MINRMKKDENEEMKSLDKGQFSQSRYALLFEASEKLHEVDVRLGYYTSVYGLGRHPKDTQVGADHPRYLRDEDFL